MALTPEPTVLGFVRKAKLLRLQLAEQVPLLHPQGHQPPLVKRYLMTSDTRTPAGQQSRLTSAAAPFGWKTGASRGILDWVDWVGNWPGSGGRMTHHSHISWPCTVSLVFCSDWVIFFWISWVSFPFSTDCPTNATHDLPTTRQRKRHRKRHRRQRHE